MNKEIISKATVVAALFTNADEMLDKYKCSKDPSVIKQLDALVKKMKPSFDELHDYVIGCDSSKQQIVKRLGELVDQGIRLFPEQIAEAEGAEPEVSFRSHHMWRSTPSRRLSNEINKVIADLFT